jgi:hypothetical protein
MPIKNLFAFDFDDTIAVTPSIIGVKRYKGDISDLSFRDWIFENNLDVHEIVDEDTDNEIIYFTSSQFAEYEKAYREDIEFIENNFIQDHYDFTSTASVDLEQSEHIESIMKILKSAYGDSNSRVVVITARGGKKPIQTLITKKEITPTNRQDIKNFLSGQGVDISPKDITTAGDIGEGPEAKVAAMEKYIKIYHPKNIFFYDDNIGNVQAIAGLCKEHFPEINITTYHVQNETIKLNGSC